MREKFFSAIFSPKRWGKFDVEPDVDGFSVAGSNRTKRWWGPNSQESEDAFTKSWSGLKLWLNPPFSMLQKVAAKIRQDHAHGVLIFPDWPARTWYKDFCHLNGTSFFPHRYNTIRMGG